MQRYISLHSNHCILNHEIYIKRCFELALKGWQDARPNPLVGAVLVHNNRIIGEGYHIKKGTAHAEVMAIKNCTETQLISESTLYVNLEPCCFHGSTPACTDLIQKMKIKRVVFSNLDPHPNVSGAGKELLKKNQIEVIHGILDEEGKYLNRSVFKNQQLKLPWVFLKYAHSQEDFIGSLRTPNFPISNKWTRKLAHKLRVVADGILVGSTTYLFDKPQLNSRLFPGDSPAIIILDRRGRIKKSDILDLERKTIIFTSNKNHPAKDRATIKEYSDLKEMLLELYKMNVYTLMVEGGAKVLSTFIEEELWDEAFLIKGNKSGIKEGVKVMKPSIEQLHSSYFMESDEVNYYLK